MAKPKKKRLDDILIERGLFQTRDEAMRAVLAHEVKVGTEFAQSPAARYGSDCPIEVRSKLPYVSRGGLKLAGALDAFHQNVKGLHCIDVGSSTGGFTDCLLQAEAASVAAVDVNYGQLAWKLREDPRVRVYERTNIRTTDLSQLEGPFDLIVADLSFISLAMLTPVFAKLSYNRLNKTAEAATQDYFRRLENCPDNKSTIQEIDEMSHARVLEFISNSSLDSTIFIGLIKPQFESNHDETDRGVVRDDVVKARVVEEVRQALRDAGFGQDEVVASPLIGPAGNEEFLVRSIYLG